MFRGHANVDPTSRPYLCLLLRPSPALVALPAHAPDYHDAAESVSGDEQEQVMLSKESKHNIKRRAKIDAYLMRNLAGYHPLGSLSPKQAMKDLRKLRKLIKV